MRARLAIVTWLALSIFSAHADEICGEKPLISDPAISRRIDEAILGFKFSSQSGAAFEHTAAKKYREIIKDRPPNEARVVALALLHAQCVDTMRNENPAKLHWVAKDRLVGLSKLILDFREAYALLDRIKERENRR